MMKHMQKGDYKKADAGAASGSGISLVYLTVDSDEHADRFTKQLFSKGLIATAVTQEGGFQRTYLKFGRMTTEKGRDRLELTTSNDNVKALIDYINDNNPNSYDYPVPDISVIPVENGNPAFVKWVKSHTGPSNTLNESSTRTHNDDDE